MRKQITFQQAVDYLNEGLNYTATGKSGVVTLKNASQEDCLIMQSENGGDRVSLFAPFLKRPEKLATQKILNLHFLHLNADLDVLGPLRIMLNTDSNQYSLCDGAVMADSAADFVEYVKAALQTAQYLHNEIADVLAQAEANEELSEGDVPDTSNYLKA